MAALGTFSALIDQCQGPCIGDHYPSLSINSNSHYYPFKNYHIICMHDVGEGRTCCGICVAIIFLLKSIYYYCVCACCGGQKNMLVAHMWGS